ncbi:hypothetical protein BKA82DRAFT_33601 [Pisolithus tinctorius]|nr:hypothetical protein BKA82DRAFT_33601 [Pisolithus tinctorius]
MPTTAKPVSPFFGDDSTVPLPLPSMLTDQIELFGSPRHPTTLLADEVLAPAGLDTRQVIKSEELPNSRRSTPAPEFRLAQKPKSTKHRTSPYSKRPVIQRASSTMPSSEEDSAAKSVESSDSDCASSVLSDDSKTPKPTGEPGRPGRGGYTLEIALDWNHKTYVKFKKLIFHLIDEHLDVTKCASAQNPTLLRLVRNKAVAAFPDLDNYANAWPVSDMIMMRLKYTSSRARRQEVEMAAGKTKWETRSAMESSAIAASLARMFTTE